ncbi:MAG: PEP-CTERM sorting domain-containing protein [Rhodocyclaceae bacterium]
MPGFTKFVAALGLCAATQLAGAATIASVDTDNPLWVRGAYAGSADLNSTFVESPDNSYLYDALSWFFIQQLPDEDIDDEDPGNGGTDLPVVIPPAAVLAEGVPEPASLALVGLGLMAALVARRTKKVRG